MTEIMELVKQYICPELIVLIPVLYFIGMAIRKSEKIDNRYIPVMLAVFGIILSALYMLGTITAITFNTFFSTVFAAIVQGILCAAGAVFVNETKKQMTKSE